MHLIRCAAILGLTLALQLSQNVNAMGSANYSIPFGVMNAAGGPMTSANFRLLASIGEGSASFSMNSPNNSAGTGFIAQLYGSHFSCILDIDGNGQLDASTDGLMLLRSMFGLTGTAVTSNAIGQLATKTTWAAIQPLIHPAALDIDGDGKTDALTDGLLLVRALFGLSGGAVTQNAVGQNATRATWPAIRDHLNSVCKAAIQ